MHKSAGSRRVSALLAASVLIIQVLGLLAQPGQDKKSFEGELTYVDYHDGTGDWALLDKAVRKFEPLGKGKKPPKKDKNNKDLQPGPGEALWPPLARPVHDHWLHGGPHHGPSLLVVIVDAPACGAAAASGATVSNLQSLYFGPNLDGKGGWAVRLENCSYGEVVWEPPTSGLTQFVTVTPSCSWPTATCDAYAMSNAANAAARAKLGDLVFYDFTHFHLVMAVPSACSWAGLATLGGGVGGGGQVWLNTNTWTQTFGTFQVPLQESIHNFVLYHGFASGIEYQDKTTFMGTGQACPSVTEKRWLGWASPITGADSLDEFALTPSAASGPFNLPASWTTGLGNHVRVKPTWASWYNNTNYGMNLYFEFRQAMLGDASMDVTYANKVVVHEILSYMDNDQVTYRSSDPRSNYITNVAPNTRTVLSSPSLGVPYSLVLYVGAQFGSQSEFVPMYICRFITADTECDTLANVLANAPKSSPPPPRPLTPPSPPSPPPPGASPPLPPTKPPSPSPPSPRPPSPRPPSPSPPKPPAPKPPSPRPPNPSPPPKNQKSPSAKPGERAPPLPPVRTRPRRRSPPPSRHPRTRSSDAADVPAPASSARR
ncbi:hypothetical protein CHLRE_07g353600v5 [Chlamydomonas reinhardtii]|uniref:Peptidase M11 gametolysin domain-containing protein n=1 Tax=Chlamydomonas reinhardtii TaxID=3055 RepID=A0A2K3DLI7_CHLRE|nr:uncharacterized protein CHLRE_07g353600v5 [Chlamydomonas reinhardtii]PNW81383.1 hypothetical protein CHLRE_07g353600v5 [Chlamydomonas reinhardtii]